MRHLTLVEQMASYDHGGGVFAMSDPVPGRLAWSTAAMGESFECFYRASNADESQWEIGLGGYSAGEVARITAIQSSTGSAVNFSGGVRVALIAPAGALWAIDGAAAYRSADAKGLYAMAAGQQAAAYGENALALGFTARVGDSGTPRDAGLALGAYATVGHEYATALGTEAVTLIKAAVHIRRAFWWSAEGETEDDAPYFPAASGSSVPVLPPTGAVALRALVVGRNSDDTKHYSAELKAMIKRGASGAAVLLGSTSVEEIYKTPAITVAASIAINGADGGFGVQVVGQSGEFWLWGVELEGVWVL